MPWGNIWERALEAEEARGSKPGPLETLQEAGVLGLGKAKRCPG